VTIRLPRFWRALGACAVIVAWFAVSNHCGLAMIDGLHGLERSAHACCDSQPSGAPAETPAGAVKICCKQLRVPWLEAGATLVTVHPETLRFEIAWTRVVDLCALAGARNASHMADAAGPPGSHRFAEIVLQHSLLSHAPPAGV
jgi:hypothetical protein